VRYGIVSTDDDGLVGTKIDRGARVVEEIQPTEPVQFAKRKIRAPKRAFTHIIAALLVLTQSRQVRYGIISTDNDGLVVTKIDTGARVVEEIQPTEPVRFAKRKIRAPKGPRAH
jgi:hypothetical protein